MSKFNVTSQELQAAINTLREDNSQFRSRVTDLVNKQSELSSQWQGDANTAFNNAFTRDKGQWDTFATLIDNYVETLESIKQAYEAAESANTSTATSRTY